MTLNRGICLALVVLSITGVVVASYLTSVHYASVPLACSSTGVINCEQVLTSRYSEVLGIPWSVGGIVWFTVSAGLALVALMKRPEPEALHPAQVGWALTGLAVAVYLIGVELVAVKHICIWCSSMHALILVSLLLVLFRQPDAELDDDLVEADTEQPVRQLGR